MKKIKRIFNTLKEILFYIKFAYKNSYYYDCINAFDEFAEHIFISFVEKNNLFKVDWINTSDEHKKFINELWINYFYLKYQRPKLEKYKIDLEKRINNTVNNNWISFIQSKDNKKLFTVKSNVDNLLEYNIYSYIDDIIEKNNYETREWIFKNKDFFWI